MNTIENVVDVDFVAKYGDPRVQFLPGMESSKTTLAIISLYLLFVLVIGPKWMQNRKPYDLSGLMMAYNASCVALSVWIFLRIAMSGWFKKYSWRCEPVDFSNDEDAIKVLHACYLFYVSKFYELADTVFMVLRKKNKQVTFLHVYHHASTPLIAWILVKYGGGGYLSIVQILNSFIHIWMYLYYFLSSMGPSVQKYIFWKKSMTELQLVQFVIMGVSMGQALLFPPERCNVRFFPAVIMVCSCIFYFIMFSLFYVQAYKKKTSKNS